MWNIDEKLIGSVCKLSETSLFSVWTGNIYHNKYKIENMWNMHNSWGSQATSFTCLWAVRTFEAKKISNEKAEEKTWWAAGFGWLDTCRLFVGQKQQV